MSDDLQARADWMLRDSPRGENMPIDCTYRFSFGRRVPEAGDLPDGWTLGGFYALDPEVEHFPTMGPHAIQEFPHVFLVNPEGEPLAVWDEGRWWTPDESRAWMTMLQVPATYVMAEGMRQAQMPRWWRRRKRK